MQYIVDKECIYLLIKYMTKNKGLDRRTILKSFAAAINLAVEPSLVGRVVTGQLLSNPLIQKKRRELLDVVSQIIDGDSSLFWVKENIFQATHIKICEAMMRDGKSSPDDIKDYIGIASRQYQIQEAEFKKYRALYKEHLSEGAAVHQLVENYKRIVDENNIDISDTDMGSFDLFRPDRDNSDILLDRLKEFPLAFQEAVQQSVQKGQKLSEIMASEGTIDGMAAKEWRAWISKVRQLDRYGEEARSQYLGKDTPRQRFETFFDGIEEDLTENIVRHGGSISACLNRYRDDPEDWEYMEQFAQEAEIVDWEKERADYLDQCWDNILKGNDYY